MKALTVIFLAGMAFVAGSPAFAGRDESQMMQQQRAAKEAQAGDKVLRAKNIRLGQQGLAGATGMPGKIGPEGQPTKPRRDPSAHP